MADKNCLHFEVHEAAHNVAKATITVPAPLISSLFEHAAASQIHKTEVYGFSRGTVPVSYIKEHFKPKLINHLQEFLFKYYVISFLYKHLNQERIHLVGEPRLDKVEIEPGQNGIFHFNLSLTEPIEFFEWKLFPFKAPKRKNYKDIDRQVEFFIKEEQENIKNHSDTSIYVGDWVLFEIQLVDAHNKPLLETPGEQLWLKIGDEEADIAMRDLFVGKKQGEIFYTNHQSFQEYFSDELQTQYTFQIHILDVVPKARFCFDELKRHFRLKNNKDMHHKLIEVFSYRNDLSQRRLMVEEVFNLLLARHPFNVSNYFILRQEENVLKSVIDNPDYHVYKNERSFKDYIKKLAAKQIRETILMDQLKQRENIQINNQDTRSYLNLTKRSRTKEFLYFEAPESKINGQEIPIPSEIFKHIVQREKTLNYVIYYLTKDE